MGDSTRKRHDPRRDATRIALIEAAESLFAESGVEGVSTRQIGAAIGSSNTNVVAYHFGSKEALMEAVCRHRLPDIDRRRGELLDAADLSANLFDLVRIFALPLYEQVDASGRHSFARFLAGLERSGMMMVRALLLAGCDKVSINSAAVKDPDFVFQAARRFGSQCIVVNIDPKRIQRGGAPGATPLPARTRRRRGTASGTRRSANRRERNTRSGSIPQVSRQRTQPPRRFRVG